MVVRSAGETTVTANLVSGHSSVSTKLCPLRLCNQARCKWPLAIATVACSSQAVESSVGDGTNTANWEVVELLTQLSQLQCRVCLTQLLWVQPEVITPVRCYLEAVCGAGD